MDAEARYAQLEERVGALGRDHQNFQADVNRSFSDVRDAISALGVELRRNMDSFKESQRPQWQAVSVALVFAGMVGALAYLPIREAQTDIKDRLRELGREALSVEAFQAFKSTYENQRLVARQDYENRFNKLESDARDQQKQIVPRGEHEGYWRSTNLQIADLQRQIEVTQKMYGDAYSLRDFVRDLQARLDRLESRRPAS